MVLLMSLVRCRPLLVLSQRSPVSHLLRVACRWTPVGSGLKRRRSLPKGVAGRFALLVDRLVNRDRCDPTTRHCFICVTSFTQATERSDGPFEGPEPR